ncbi:MAG TPA: hypothetical protein VKT29_05325 [Terriglobales bacterium]|nr:hypothetical protein [Terriglobales bacterium]
MTLRRMKTYTGETGYVYQYYFVGKREALADAAEAPATEYIFDVTPDRKTVFAVSVFVRREALAAWAARHGRPLTEPEQYAAAKMRLFQGFDRIDDLRQQSRRLPVDAGNVEELLAGLGVE